MLKSLSVTNFALIRNMQFHPGEGLNVVTGETGAGKSIMLGALGLVLGNRADISAVASEKDKCIVEAVFEGNSMHAAAFLAAHDLDSGDEILLRREISATGKSRAFINDTPVTLNDLRELGSLLIEIHTQNTHLLIRDSAMQLQLLDDYGTEKLLLQHHAENWEVYKTGLEKLRLLTESAQKARMERDFLQFQFDELERLQPVAGEDAELEEKTALLSHAAEVSENAGRAAHLLFESETSVYNQLSGTRSLLKNISGINNELKNAYEKLESLMLEVRELSADLGHVAERAESDPAELERLQQRMASLQQIMRKHDAASVEGLVLLHQSLSEKLLLADQAGEQLEALEKETDQLRNLCLQSAQELHAAREKSAKALSEEAAAILHKLGMPKARLKVNLVFDHGKLGPAGATAVQLLFNADGAAELPLDKVASGGEVSRLNFCFKSLVARNKQLPTVVFDEVDTGVSGEVAIRFGELMKTMGSGHQIITITHLPQVAAQGDVHFLVYKDEEQGKTTTRLKKLDERERVGQIAAMLGGRDPGEAALANARDLLGLS